jgi:hypothetical protein
MCVWWGVVGASKFVNKLTFKPLKTTRLKAMGVSNNNSVKCQSFHVFLLYCQLNEPLALKSFDYETFLLV